MKQQSASIQELKAELGTGLLAQLSSAERGELSALNGRLQQLQADESAAEQHLLEAQVRLLPTNMIPHIHLWLNGNPPTSRGTWGP